MSQSLLSPWFSSSASSLYSKFFTIYDDFEIKIMILFSLCFRTMQVYYQVHVSNTDFFLSLSLSIPCRLAASDIYNLIANGTMHAAVFGTIHLIDTANLTVKVSTLPVWLALPAALYFVLSANRQDSRYPDWLSLVGFLPVLWCIAAVADTYTDQFTAMNSPIKISLQMGFLGLALILVSELRFRLGKALPRVATALMSIGVFFSMNGAIPVLLGTGAHLLDNELHLFYSFVLLCGGVYGAFTLGPRTDLL